MALRDYERYEVVEPLERIQETVQQPQRQQQPKKQQVGRKMFSKGEKVMFVLFSIVVVTFALVLLNNQSQLSKVNREVHSMSRAIQDAQQQNAQLLIQINEKSSYERVWQKAKERGLHLNESNVKVVPGR